MVNQIRKKGKGLYSCGICGLAYTEKSLANKCRAWCKTHSSCNLEIARHAIK